MLPNIVTCYPVDDIFKMYLSVFQRHTNDVRLSIVHNPTTLPAKDDTSAHYISRAIQTALNVLEPGMAKSFITKLLKPEYLEQLKSGTKKLEDLAVNVS